MNNIIFDKRIVDEFKNYGSKDKEILWAGRPSSFLIYFRNNFVILAISFVGYLLMFNFFFADIFKDKSLIELIKERNTFVIMFSFMMLMSFLQSVLFPILNYFKTYYAITPNEIIIKSGVLSTTYQNINYWRIQEITLNDSYLSRKDDIGNISYFDGETSLNENNRKSKVYKHLLAINDVEQVYQLIKKLMSEKFNSNSIPKDDNYSDYATVID